VPAPNSPRELSEGRWAAAAAVGSRLLLAVVAVLTTLTIGVSSRALFLRDPRHAEVLEGFAKRLFEPWAHWDGVWFVRIAADGYAAHESSQAFFPLYPLLVRTVAPLTGGNYVIAGVVVSLA
jgi:Gpi18-like mannosyltransferase